MTGSAPVDAAGARPRRRIAAHLAGGVLGAGMLVMPSVVAALAGGHSLLVWAAHLALGGSVALVLALVVRDRVGSTSLAGAVGVLLGRWAQRLVDGVFAVAFTAGQAAIAWFAATCLVTAATGSTPGPGVGVLLLALGVLAVAVLAALSPLVPPAAVLRWRWWVTGVLALACAAWGWPASGPHTPLAPSGLGISGALWLAFAALFFAGVGWEAVTTVVPATAAGPGRTAAGVLLGTALVAVGYLGLAAVYRSAGSADPVAAPVRWVLGLATATVLTSFCFTNVRTAARIAGRLRPEPEAAGRSRVTLAVVGLACAAFAWAGTGDGAVPLLLLGPAAAALVGYALGAVAAVRRGGPLLKCAGAAVLLVLAGTALVPVRFLLDG
ncbi:amino acid:polyamine antiporter [Actinosynnema sp. NPDC020468]|uniref:amino acid:polyamine antiporter n=1 Tax=Actinosynnema sp. NPDC020468 TaxID=3154488 RepID=UPI0033F2A1A9